MLNSIHIIQRFSAKDIIPKRYYPLFLSIVFIASFFAAYIAITPINHYDWIRSSQHIRFMLRGVDLYCADSCGEFQLDADLAWSQIDFMPIPYSPWIVFYFAPIAYSTVHIPVALSVAAWIIIILDNGYIPALILILHPSFIMLWAAANLDFLVSGVGLWLILRGVHGWRRGIALMLIAIKPHVLFLLLLLEGVRLLWEADWEALATMGIIAVASMMLFPGWITEMVPAYLAGGLSRSGVELGKHIEAAFPFSVYGAWGLKAAALVSALLIGIMWHRLTEWRTLAVLLSFIWTPYVNPYSFAVLLLLFQKSSWWRISLYLVLSLLTLPFLFGEYHLYEQYGTLLFLLGAALLSGSDASQREEVIAKRSSQHPLPLVRFAARAREQFTGMTR